MAHGYVDFLEPDEGALDPIADLPDELTAGLPFPPPYIPTPPPDGNSPAESYDGTLAEVVFGAGGPDDVPSTAGPDEPGYYLPTYAEDLYDRIHLSPVAIELGNVVQSQVRTFRLWNAHMTEKTLASIIGTNDDGLTIVPPTPPGAAPTEFPRSTEYEYQLFADDDGPTNINASYLFAFGAEEPMLIVTGTRIISWPFDPQTGVKETLGFKTDIMEARDGHEQRVRVRRLPRQTFGVEYKISVPRERTTMLNRLLGNSGNLFAVPVWIFARKLLAAVAPGATTISVDTTNADFRQSTDDKTELYMIWRAYNDFEIVQATVGGVSATGIQLVSAIEGTHAAGSYVIPMQLMLARDPVAWRSRGNGVMTATVQWLSAEQTDLAATDGELTLYDGSPVLADLNYIEKEIEEQLSRKYDLFDSETGVFEALHTRLIPEFNSSKGWECDTPAESWATRKLIYALRGRQRSFWLPTWRQDFVMVSTLGSSDTTIEVQDTGYSRFVRQQAPFDRVMIETHSGTRYFRRITNSSLDAGGFEILTIDSALGASLNVSDIKYFCYLVRCRLGSDDVDITHPRLGAMSLRPPVVGVMQ